MPNHQAQARASPISLNVSATPRAQLDGRDHLIVPAVGIIEGVLNGELALRDEFAHHVEAWNGRPVTLRHPEQDGLAVSANSPGVIEDYQIGQVFGACLDGDRLRVEMWIDIQKAHEIGAEGDQLLTALEAGSPTEVSTGYFCDRDLTAGEFNGEVYTAVQRGIKPDHLAILLDQEGGLQLDGRLRSTKDQLQRKRRHELV